MLIERHAFSTSAMLRRALFVILYCDKGVPESLGPRPIHGKSLRQAAGLPRAGGTKMARRENRLEGNDR